MVAGDLERFREPRGSFRPFFSESPVETFEHGHDIKREAVVIKLLPVVHACPAEMGKVLVDDRKRCPQSIGSVRIFGRLPVEEVGAMNVLRVLPVPNQKVREGTDVDEVRLEASRS